MTIQRKREEVKVEVLSVVLRWAKRRRKLRVAEDELGEFPQPCSHSRSHTADTC
jgi:hypothetical protein